MRIVVAITTQHKWKVYQMDVKSMFLNGVLKEEVNVAQPPGYEVEGQEDKVYRLRKSLYGRRQAPRAWYNRIDAYLLENGFDKCDSEPTLYIKESDVKQVENDIFISQAKYVADILERSNMQNSKPAPNPILMGLNLSKEYCSSNVNPTLYKRSEDDRKNTSAYVFHLGSGAISWASKKQPIVSLSIVEVEYVVETTTTCQTVWMRRVLRDLCHDQEGKTTIFCNNTSTIALPKNSVFHKRTKHIDAKYHFIRELINNAEIVLQHCRSQEQYADIFTKPLARESFVYFRYCLGIVNGGNYD
eukprot:PITA_16758